MKITYGTRVFTVHYTVFTGVVSNITKRLPLTFFTADPSPGFL